jgi:hypothetical protein
VVVYELTAGAARRGATGAKMADPLTTTRTERRTMMDFMVYWRFGRFWQKKLAVKSLDERESDRPNCLSFLYRDKRESKNLSRIQSREGD